MVLRGDAVGDVVGGDVDAGSSVYIGDLPRHGHRARVGGVVRYEFSRLDDPHADHNVDKANLYHVESAVDLPGAAEST